ncbi:MAG: alpha/beta hydrolase [Rhodanobacter sp.]
MGNTHEVARLVVQSPDVQSEHVVGTQHYRLAEDLSAPYAQLLEHTKLRRLAWWGLIGGEEVGRRAGLFLLDEYDPAKTPVIMIHGLASSPVIWARLSNAIMGDAELHRHYQIWHVVYQTNAPLLVDRHRIQSYLDTAWQILDPRGDAPARQHGVFVGHSLGGVISRLLCAESTPALWSAAFTVPLSDLHASAADLALLGSTFQFTPYPGIDEAIFMASPQRGSPEAGEWLGRVAQSLAWRHIPELSALERITSKNPQDIQPGLLQSFRLGRLSSVTSLLPDQPVSRVDEQLMPVPGVRYHTIAGVIVGHDPPGDGYVPLSSALLPGAASTLIVHADHHGVPNDPEAITAVLDILRQHEALH